MRWTIWILLIGLGARDGAGAAKEGRCRPPEKEELVSTRVAEHELGDGSADMLVGRMARAQPLLQADLDVAALGKPGIRVQPLAPTGKALFAAMAYNLRSSPGRGQYRASAAKRGAMPVAGAPENEGISSRRTALCMLLGAVACARAPHVQATAVATAPGAQPEAPTIKAASRPRVSRDELDGLLDTLRLSYVKLNEQRERLATQRMTRQQPSWDIILATVTTEPVISLPKTLERMDQIACQLELPESLPSSKVCIYSKGRPSFDVYLSLSEFAETFNDGQDSLAQGEPRITAIELEKSLNKVLDNMNIYFNLLMERFDKGGVMDFSQPAESGETPAQQR